MNLTQGGGARYPYPKDVWSPAGAPTSTSSAAVADSRAAGGWWTRPKNWVSNTLILGASASIIAYGVWSWSAKSEVRAPSSPEGLTRSSTTATATRAHTAITLQTCALSPHGQAVRSCLGSVHSGRASSRTVRSVCVTTRLTRTMSPRCVFLRCHKPMLPRSLTRPRTIDIGLTCSATAWFLKTSARLALLRF